jgi:hypothetical protein
MYKQSRLFSDVQPISKEVESNTDATISCVITGISRQLESVVWKKDGSDVKTLSESDYIVSVGIYGSNSQTTTLTVKAAANKVDSAYNCAIRSDEWLQSNKETTVALEVFCTTLQAFYLIFVVIFGFHVDFS